MKRYVVERTIKAEIRPEEQSQETESRRKNLWNEIKLKGPKNKEREKKTETDTRTE